MFHNAPTVIRFRISFSSLLNCATSALFYIFFGWFRLCCMREMQKSDLHCWHCHVGSVFLGRSSFLRFVSVVVPPPFFLDVSNPVALSCGVGLSLRSDSDSELRCASRNYNSSGYATTAQILTSCLPCVLLSKNHPLLLALLLLLSLLPCPALLAMLSATAAFLVCSGCIREFRHLPPS